MSFQESEWPNTKNLPTSLKHRVRRGDRKMCLEMMKGRAEITPRMVSGYLLTTLHCSFEGHVSLALRGSL